MISPIMLIPLLLATEPSKYERATANLEEEDLDTQFKMVNTPSIRRLNLSALLCDKQKERNIILDITRHNLMYRFDTHRRQAVDKMLGKINHEISTIQAELRTDKTPPFSCKETGSHNGVSMKLLLACMDDELFIIEYCRSDMWEYTLRTIEIFRGKLHLPQYPQGKLERVDLYFEEDD
jgi:hypothetical protein